MFSTDANFLLNIFSLQLIGSTDVEPVDREPTVNRNDIFFAHCRCLLMLSSSF